MFDLIFDVRNAKRSIWMFSEQVKERIIKKARRKKAAANKLGWCKT